MHQGYCPAIRIKDDAMCDIGSTVHVRCKAWTTNSTPVWGLRYWPDELPAFSGGDSSEPTIFLYEFAPMLSI